MLKVMIVDDEYIVREDIRCLIDWASYGYEIVAEAANGKQGLENFLRYTPDIVFSDIRMPIMDGFEMIEKIASGGGECEFILLTGYDDFEYARKAINLNLNSYLLKHEMNAQILLKVLGKAAEILVAKGYNRQILRGNLFREILLRKVKTEDLIGLQEAGSLQVKSGISYLLLFDGSMLDMQDTITTICNRTEGVKLYSVVDDGELYIAIIKLMIIGQKDTRRLIAQLITALTESVLDIDRQRLNVVVSRGIHDLGKMQQECVYAKSLFRYMVFYTGGCNVIYGDGWKTEMIEAMDLETHLSEIKTMLDAFRYIEMEEVCENFVRKCSAKKDVETFERWKQQLFFYLEEHSVANNLDSADFLLPLKQEQPAIKMLDCIRALLLHFDSQTIGVNTRKIRKVLLFIEQNYQLDITLDDIAKILYINQVYAGQLFKKETGITFKKYLTQLRIEKAIELLQSGDYKIYEISQMVGYQTIQYFSSKFKQITGKSPSDYL